MILRYPTREPNVPGHIAPQVKLELGSLTDQRPTGENVVTPWVAEEFPSLFKGPQSRVVVLEAERTFWEKATILHAEYHRPKDKPMRNRLSRDCYDICCMASHSSGKRALADLDLLARVVEYKRTYFSSSWANYDAAKPGTFRLVPPEHRIADLRTDYQEMQPMFMKPPPTFDELLAQLKGIEEEINRGHEPCP